MDAEPAAWQLPSPRRYEDVMPPDPTSLQQPQGTSSILEGHANLVESAPLLPADRWAAGVSIKDVTLISARTRTGRHMISDIVLLQAEVKAFQEMTACRIQAERGEFAKLYNMADDLSAQLAHFAAMPSSFASYSKFSAPTVAKKRDMEKAVALDKPMAFPGSKVRMSSQELRDAQDELGALDRDLTWAISPRRDYQRRAPPSSLGQNSSAASQLQKASASPKTTCRTTSGKSLQEDLKVHGVPSLKGHSSITAQSH